MDVISAEEAGVQNAVASMGTSLTEEHADLIKRLTNRAIICYDGDRAGIEAAYKAGTLLVERNRLDVLFCNFQLEKIPMTLFEQVVQKNSKKFISNNE